MKDYPLLAWLVPLVGIGGLLIGSLLGYRLGAQDRFTSATIETTSPSGKRWNVLVIYSTRTGEVVRALDYSEAKDLEE